MAERPILFSAPMVRAILAGTKTQTRRVVKLKPWHQIEERDDGSPWPWMHDNDRDADHWLPCPYGQPGDRLWVRETWCGPFKWGKNDGKFAYRADPESLWPENIRTPYLSLWKPSIHMPRWASRITLEVTGVRVERLQDISEADAQAEGARECDPVSGREVLLAGPSQRGSFVLHYRDIWEQINGPGSWDANPWVWVVEFKRLEVQR